MAKDNEPEETVENQVTTNEKPKKSHPFLTLGLEESEDKPPLSDEDEAKMIEDNLRSKTVAEIHRALRDQAREEPDGGDNQESQSKDGGDKDAESSREAGSSTEEQDTDQDTQERRQPVEYSISPKGQELTEPEPSLPDDQDVDDSPAEDRQKHPIEELPKEDRQLLEMLDEDDRDEAQFYADAERLQPDTFKGALRKHVDYLRKKTQKLESLAEDDPDYDASDDPSFQSWVKRNKPQYSNKQVSKAQRAIFREEVKKEIEGEYGKKLSEHERELRRVREQPIIQNQVNDWSKGLFDDIAQDDAIKPVVEAFASRGGGQDGAQAAYESDPEVAQAVFNTHNNYRAMAQSLIEYRKGLLELDESNPDPALMNLGQRMEAWSNEIQGWPAQKQVRDGKKFAPPNRFHKMKKADQQKYWTFDDNMILSILRQEAADSAKHYASEAKKHQDEMIARWARSQGMDPSEIKEYIASKRGGKPTKASAGTNLSSQTQNEEAEPESPKATPTRSENTNDQEERRSPAVSGFLDW